MKYDLIPKSRKSKMRKAALGLILLFALGACSKSKVTPGPESKKIDKLKCGSESNFNLHNEIVEALKEISRPAGSYVIRTYAIDHKSTLSQESGEYYLAGLSNGMPSELKPSEYVDSPVEMNIELNCTDLTATYQGPGVNTQFVGKIHRLSSSGISIRDVNPSGAISEITVRKINNKENPSPAARRIKLKNHNEVHFEISIKTLEKNVRRGLIIRQAFTAIENRNVPVNVSVVTDVLKIIDNPEIIGLQSQKRQTSSAISVDYGLGVPGTLIYDEAKLTQIRAKVQNHLQRGSPRLDFQIDDLMNLKNIIPAEKRNGLKGLNQTDSVRP